MRVLRTLDGMIKCDAEAVPIKPGKGYRADGTAADKEEAYGFRLHACGHSSQNPPAANAVSERREI